MVITSFRVEKKIEKFLYCYEKGMYAMPFCPACGEPIKVDTKYCPKCGYNIGEGRGRQKCECPRCRGKGYIGLTIGGIPDITRRICPECKGRKWVWC